MYGKGNSSSLVAVDTIHGDVSQELLLLIREIRTNPRDSGIKCISGALRGALGGSVPPSHADDKVAPLASW